MRRHIIYAILGSTFIHGGLAMSGYLFKENEVVAAPQEAVPTIELAQMPTLEPEPPEVTEQPSDAEASSEPADMAPPMQADTPSVSLDSPFVQQIQPPPPPGVNRPAGVITIPAGRPATGTGGGGMKNVFDLASLDQKPVATIQPRPNFPFELKRARISGQVTLLFIVDSNGEVRDPQVVNSSHREFEPEALKAILKAKFRPGKKSGNAVNTRMQQTMVFNAAKS
ncbi:energy transducer TonB [Nibricoccus aquaticus]|uniref:Energy transducer TonB n=1 Tax=Nibricoccus aquaticus TaxID=2576891 RepID=A0A290Q7V4_9BACT|nr:energy transducer TonB [Nibricoccus aquaticus]ATC64795.1 energy transducer TonB [Nibricoccus aquaticus]